LDSVSSLCLILGFLNFCVLFGAFFVGFNNIYEHLLGYFCYLFYCAHVVELPGLGKRVIFFSLHEFEHIRIYYLLNLCPLM